MLLQAPSALLAVSVPAFAQAQGLWGDLVYYTSQPNNDAQQTVDAFKARHPTIDVTYVRDGTPLILAKLRAEMEAGSPQADLLLIADSVTMESLKKDGKLLAHDKADISAYPASIHDKDKFWFSTKLITTGIVYNTKAPLKPTSWHDLLKPESKGQIALPSPLTSGAALIHTVTLTSNLPEGWSYYEKLKENRALAAGGNGDILKAVAGGEKLYGIIVDYMPIREKAKGAPVEFVFPKEGVSAVTEPIAILKSTKNPEAAKAFVDFILSPEGQDLARKQGYVPPSGNRAVPAGYPARTDIKLMGFDAAKALSDETKNKAAFADIFGQ